jgi:hypothetical protein
MANDPLQLSSPTLITVNPRECALHLRQYLTLCWFNAHLMARYVQISRTVRAGEVD